jgi:hypothetical protein
LTGLPGVQRLVEPDLGQDLGEDALDDAGDDVADDEDDEKAEQVRQEAEEAVERLLHAVADVHGGKERHEEIPLCAK